MAFSLLWSCGLIISIIIFAVAFGLMLSSGNPSNKSLAIFTVGSLIATFLLVYAMSIFKVQLNSVMGSYNYLLLFLIALILMFTGYLINDGESFRKNLTKVFPLTYLCFLLCALICIGSKDPLFGLDSLQISTLTAVLFSLIMLAAYFACRKVRVLRNSHESVGSLYIIAGIYFLVVSLFLPNIMSLKMDEMKPINVVSIESIAITIILLIVVVALGLIYYKKNTLLK